MKKGKLIALALAVGITSMGAGYAAWTDTVTIQSTVNTGKLELHLGSFTPSTGVTFNSDNADVAKVLNTSSSNADTATINLDNLYPGATAEFSINIVNDSTIPVKFANEPCKITGDLFAADYVNITAKMTYANGTTSVIKNLTTDTLKELQIPTGQDMKIDFKVEVKVTAPDAAEEKGLKFEFSPLFKQFNQ
jgi:predicted ribosomally synthesized peptide with SipW-like signal peptide